jgi:hypothetical protein
LERDQREWFRSICKLQPISKRTIERSDDPHHITEADFASIPSFFEPPEASEGFSMPLRLQAGKEEIHRQTAGT